MSLPSVHRQRPDPYCIWGELTDWVHYPGVQPPAPRPPWICRVILCLWGRITGQPYQAGCAPDGPTQHWHRVIVELVNESSGTAETFISRLQMWEVRVPSAYDPSAGARRTRFLTAWATASGLATLADTTAGKPGELVARFDLCDFAVPRRPMMMSGTPPVPYLHEPSLNGGKLIGIIDDGCAFAHSSFRRMLASGNPSTRVAAIWDQDERRPAFKVGSRDGYVYGEEERRFRYGRRIYRDYPLIPASVPQEQRPHGLDEWIGRYWRSTTRTVDEDACYADAGYDSLRRAASHGAHVMDVLAGPVRLGQRINGDRVTPPTWQRASDPASDAAQADIVFVQLPRAGLQDTSGGWLDAHVLDAVRCLLDWRGAAVQTVISLSYGSSVGPRDGSSILTQALDEIISVESTSSSAIELVMATGNAFGSRGHGAFDLKANEERSLTWRVLPASEAPGFLQIWLPCDAASLPLDVVVSVTPPGSTDTAVLHANQVSSWSSGAGVGAVAAFVASPSRGAQAMVLIALSPTYDQGAKPKPVAPHGDWTIRVKAGAADLGRVHAYVATSEKRMAGRLRGRQSYLVDARDCGRRYLDAPRDDPGTGHAWDDRLQDQALRAQGYLRRRGTINAIACGAQTEAIAGYRRNFSAADKDGSHASYSSAGMSADPLRRRTPDAAYPTDEAGTLKGMRGAGTRSGSSYRLVGTSSAAPQRARELLSPVAAAAAPPAVDVDLYGPLGKKPVA